MAVFLSGKVVVSEIQDIKTPQIFIKKFNKLVQMEGELEEDS